MRVLLDMCVLRELRHPRGNPVVRAAVALVPDDELYLSVLILGELARGVALLTDGRKKRAVNSWLTTLENQFADRILPVDHTTAHFWGDISARVEQSGLILPLVEGLLAATALQHGLYIMTHTTTRFAATGVLIVDPWKESQNSNEAE